MSSNNNNENIINLIDYKKFIQSINTLNSSLQGRKELLEVFENRKINIEGYQRHLQERVNYDIRKDFKRPIKINEKQVLKYFTRLCEDNTSLLRYYLFEDESEEEEEENENEKRREKNIIDEEYFINTISCLNICLQERTKMKEILKNRKIHIEGYQRYLQKQLNSQIRKEKWCGCELEPIFIHLEKNIKFCNRVCVSHIKTIKSLFMYHQ